MIVWVQIKKNDTQMHNQGVRPKYSGILWQVDLILSFSDKHGFLFY